MVRARFDHAPRRIVRELRDAGSFAHALVDFVIPGARPGVVIRYCLRVLRVQSELSKLAFASDTLSKLACGRLSKQLALACSHLGFWPFNPTVTSRIVRLAENSDRLRVCWRLRRVLLLDHAQQTFYFAVLPGATADLLVRLGGVIRESLRTIHRRHILKLILASRRIVSLCRL